MDEEEELQRGQQVLCESIDELIASARYFMRILSHVLSETKYHDREMQTDLKAAFDQFSKAKINLESIGMYEDEENGISH